MEKIKILEIIPSLSLSNGVAAYITNYYKSIDRSKFEFTFLVVRNREDKGRYKELLELGAKIDELYLDTNLWNYSKKVDNYFKNNKFDIVHCNVANLAFIFLKYAKKYGINSRIIHSHATVSSDKLLNRIRNDLLISVGIKYANVYFACSNAAGRAMFSKKDFYVVNNAINYDLYKFNSIIRDEYRKKLDLEGKIVIGTVGRYMYQKNQKYLLEIMKELVKKNQNYVALIIGGGPLENELNELIELYNLKNNVILLGNRDDVQKLYNIFDIFVLTSLFEGLPVVGIEAQINGLKCIFSKNITSEVDISGECTFLDIKSSSISSWVEKLNEINENHHLNKKLENAYDIKYSSKKLEELFIKLMCGDKIEE